MISEAETPPAEPLLTVEALKASYDESIILRGIDMIVPPNSVVALLGRNGVGRIANMRGERILFVLEVASFNHAARPVADTPAAAA